METIAEFDFDSFAEHFVSVEHSQTTDNNYLGMEINKFVEKNLLKTMHDEMKVVVGRTLEKLHSCTDSI